MKSENNDLTKRERGFYWVFVKGETEELVGHYDPEYGWAIPMSDEYFKDDEFEWIHEERLISPEE